MPVPIDKDRLNKSISNLFGEEKRSPSSSVTLPGIEITETRSPIDENSVLRSIDRLYSIPSANLEYAPEPEQARRQYQLSRDTGLPLDVVRTDPEAAERMRRVGSLDLDRIAIETPSLAKNLSDPTLGPAIADDVPQLSGLEQAWRTFKAVPSAVMAALGDIPANADEWAATLQGFAADILDAPPGMPEDQGAGLNEAQRKALRAGMRNYGRGDWRLFPENPFRRGQKTFEAASDRTKAAADWWLEDDMPGLGRTAQAAIGGVRSVPAMAAGILTSVMTGGASAPLWIAGFMASGEAGREAREAGKSPSERLLYQLAQGGAEVFTELAPVMKLLGDLNVGSGYFKTLLNQALVEIPQEQLATVWQDFQKWMFLHPERTLVDFLEERPQAAWETLVGTITGVGTMTTATYVPVYLDRRQSKAEQRRNNLERAAADVAMKSFRYAQEQDTLDSWVGTAKESVTLKRDVQLFQSATAETLGTQDVYIDAEEARAFFGTEGNPSLEDFARLVPEAKEQMGEAILTRGDLVLPANKVVSALALDDRLTELQSAMRLTIESQTEADTRSEAEARLAPTLDGLEAAESRDVWVDAQMERVRRDIVATGRTDRTAGLYAQAFRAFYDSQASRLSDPEALATLDRAFEGLTFRRAQAETVAPETMEQRKPLTPFGQTADFQRGEPEKAMGRVQRATGGGVMNFVVEHVGDLTHRMSEKFDFLLGQRRTVLDKVEKSLDTLTNEYGFEREHADNLRNNFDFNVEKGRLRPDQFEEFRDQVNAELQAYADAHKQVPVWNEAQRRARDAAVALGERRFDDARRDLEWLRDLAKDEERYAAAVAEGQEGGQARLLQPTSGRASVTESPEFRQWFAGSKVVDAAGQPLVMYHATLRGGEIDSFFPIAHFGTAQAAHDRLGYHRNSAIGFRPDQEALMQEGEAIIPVYLRIENPLRVEDNALGLATGIAYQAQKAGIITAEQQESIRNNGEGKEKIISLLEEAGYDGLIYTNKVEDSGSDSYVAFRPEQVKSAVGNVGTFDPANESILFQPAAPLDSAPFKAWFDDSKIVDENGNPLVVYHGTASFDDFSEFDVSPARTGAATGFNTFGRGVYMTPNTQAAWRYSGPPLGTVGGERILPLFASIKAPVVLAIGTDAYREYKAFITTLGPIGQMDRGEVNERIDAYFRETYPDADGVIVKDRWGTVQEIVARDSSQVKSAIGNVGTFDLASPNILHQGPAGDSRISARTPTGPSATEDPITSVVDLDIAVAKRDPGLVEKLASSVTAHIPETARSGSANDIIETFIEQAADNLVWVWNQIPRKDRERTRRWYVGARAMAQRMSDRYGLETHTVAGIIARLSPSTDWDLNVSMAERIIDITLTKQDYRWDKRMGRTASRIFAGPKYATALLLIRNKRLKDLSRATLGFEATDLAAMWVRIYDETYNQKKIRPLSPEGWFASWFSRDLSWQSVDNIARAISILRNPSHENISGQLGEGHKIRSFYNNIIQPGSLTDITVDTHAVAAAHLIPYSSNSPTVKANFSGPPSSMALGLNGTYILYHEAYRRAAERLGGGVLPREVQSVTWEAARALFSRAFKRSEDARRLRGEAPVVEALWSVYYSGGATLDATRQAAWDAAGGLAVEQTDRPLPARQKDASQWDSSYQGELPGDELPGGGTRPAATGGRSGAAGLRVLLQSAPPPPGEVGRGPRAALPGDGRVDSPPVRADGRVQLTHFSRRGDLKVLDPEFYGSAQAGDEKRRRDNDPENWVNRTYYGIAVGQEGGYRKEVRLGTQRYDVLVDGARVYDIGADSEGVRPAARAEADSTGGTYTSIWERMVRDAGYTGYWVAHPSYGLVAALYEKQQPVTQEELTSGATERQVPGPFAAPIPVDRLGRPEGYREHLGRFGLLVEGDTTERLKKYDLAPLIEDEATLRDWLEDIGWTIEVFSFHEDPDAGVTIRIPRLKKSYDRKVAWIYDPRVAHGSFKDVQYTRVWRVTHEIAHGIVERYMQQRYGDSRRYGRLGRTMEGERGTPPKRIKVELQALTLAEAQRAVEWEDVAFRAQRLLLRDLGVTVPDSSFAEEYNTNISDAVYRVVSGDFGNPGEVGFLPYPQLPDLRGILQTLEATEQSLAVQEGRGATQGIDLSTWEPVTDEELSAAVSEALGGKEVPPVRTYYQGVPSTDEQEGRSGLGVRVSEDLHRTITGRPAAPGWAEATRIRRRGAPGLVYRGSRGGTRPATFDRESYGKASGAPQSGLGVWFSTTERSASGYGAKLDALYVDMRNPFALNAEDLPYFPTVERAKAYAADLEAQGYDGIFISGKNVGGPSRVVVFNADQVVVPQEAAAPSFQQEARAAIELPPQGVAEGLTVINLFEKADLSSILHESGHFYLEVQRAIAKLPNLSPEWTKNWNATLTWLGSTDGNITVEQHEKFARGFEQYLREGVAPNRQLRRSFQAFKRWLVKIYEDIRDLKVEMTPESRGIFDRLLATEAEIETAKSEVLVAPNQNFMALLTPAERRAYLARVERQAETAKEKLWQRLYRQFKRDTRKWWQAEEAEVRKEVEHEVDRQPVYRALLLLRKGLLNPEDDRKQAVKLSRKQLKKLYPDLEVPDGVTGKNSAHPDPVAELLGFRNGREMITAMNEAPPRDQLVEELVEREMINRHGDILRDGTIERRAREALENEDRSSVLLYELQVLQRNAGDAKETRQGYDRLADEMLGNLTVADLGQSERYHLSEVRAARAVGRHLATKNYKLAAEAKRQQLLSHLLYRKSRETRGQVEKALRRFRRYLRPQTRKKVWIDEDYHKMLGDLLGQYNLRRGRLTEAAREKLSQEALRNWMAAKEKLDGAQFVVPDAILQSTKPHYRDLSVSEFLALADVADNIAEQGRRTRQILVSGKKVSLKAADEAVAATIEANLAKRPRMLQTRLPAQERQRSRESYWFGIAKVRTLVRLMDGWKDLGLVHEHFQAPIDDAEHAKVQRLEEAAEAVMGIFKEHYGTWTGGLENLKRKVPRVAGLPDTNFEGVLAVALNWGNRDNRLKLLDGHTMTEDQARALLANMSENDWRFVQRVWDYLDSFWPEIAALEKRTKGITPKKVPADPFTVTTSEGTTITLRGGYYSLKYDDRLTPDIASPMSMAMHDVMAKGRFASAQTQQGHNEARKEGVRKPVRLDLGVLFSHVNQVITDLTMREALDSTWRLLHAPKTKAAIFGAEKLGPVAYAQMEMWLKDLAIGTVIADSMYENWLDGLRAGVSIAAMGFSYTTFAVQITGLLQTSVRLGPVATLRGFTRLMGMGRIDPDQANRNTAMAWEKSKILERRATTFHRDVFDALRMMERKGRIRGPLAKAAFWPIAKMQLLVDVITWLGAYESGLKKFAGEEAKSVRFADEIVEQTQSSGLFKDLSAFERGTTSESNRLSALVRLWTVFYTYFNSKLNLAYEQTKKTDFRRPTQVARLATDYLLLFSLEAVLTEILLGRVPDFGGDDDEEKALWWGAKLSLQNISAMLPGAREIAAGFQGFGATPAGLRGLETISRAARSVWDDVSKFAVEDETPTPTEVARSVVPALGVAFKLPTKQVAQALRAMEEAEEGKDVSWLDYLVYRKENQR